MLLHHTTALLLTIIYPSALTFTCCQDETVGSWTVRSGTEISLTHQVFKSFSQMPQMFEFTKSKKIVFFFPHAKWLKMCFIKTSLATIQKLLQRSYNRNIFLFSPRKSSSHFCSLAYNYDCRRMQKNRLHLYFIPLSCAPPPQRTWRCFDWTVPPRKIESTFLCPLSSIITLWLYMNRFLAESFQRQPQGHLRWASHCQNCLASTRSLCLEETRRSTQFLLSKRTVGSSRTGHTDRALADLHLKGNSCKLVIWADFTLQAKDSFYYIQKN